jgi:hypothetical protein
VGGKAILNIQQRNNVANAKPRAGLQISINLKPKGLNRHHVFLSLFIHFITVA